MTELFNCTLCNGLKPAAEFPPAKTRRGIKKTCTKCDIEREQRKNARRLAVRRAQADRENADRKVELSSVIAGNRTPAMLPIVPAGSEWAKWWQELLDAETNT